MQLLNISDLPRFLKERVRIPESARDKSALDQLLVEMLEDFFSTPRLVLDPEQVVAELAAIQQPSTEKALSKLRYLLEQQCRRDIAQYCATMNSDLRARLVRALHQAGTHNFRQNIETDLYVGIHTAISANFKMMGVVFTEPAIPIEVRGDALARLFRALRVVAAQPLGILLVLDGLFWDRLLYLIPTGIVWRPAGDGGAATFFLEQADLERRLESAQISELAMGCPAMRARNGLDLRVIDIVQQTCVDTARRFGGFLPD